MDVHGKRMRNNRLLGIIDEQRKCNHAGSCFHMSHQQVIIRLVESLLADDLRVITIPAAKCHTTPTAHPHAVIIGEPSPEPFIIPPVTQITKKRVYIWQFPRLLSSLQHTEPRIATTGNQM